MATKLKKQSAKSRNSSTSQKKQSESVPKPKRLSKFALWRMEHPDGVLEYVDWRAVNK